MKNDKIKRESEKARKREGEKARKRENDKARERQSERTTKRENDKARKRKNEPVNYLRTFVIRHSPVTILHSLFTIHYSLIF